MTPPASLKASAAVKHPTRVASARERLLSGEALPNDTVRSVIEASWQRCLSEHVDPQSAHPSNELDNYQLEQLCDKHQELISASKIIMREAHELLAASSTIMHLVAPSGVILRCDGDPGTLALARNFSLVAGADWNESVAGTNAIGTALNVSAPIQVHAFEHFCEDISGWTCSAAVIRDPFENRVLGVVNISGLKNTLHDYCLALAISGARRIEGQFAQMQLAKRDRLLAQTSDRFSVTGTDGVLLFDLNGRLIRANSQADNVLAARGIKLDLTTYNPILTLDTNGCYRAQSEPVLGLLEHQWIEPVVEGGERLGFMATIALPTRPAKPAPAQTGARVVAATSTGFSRLVGESPAFVKTIRQAERLAKAPIPVLLQGETGVGKELFAKAMHEVGPTRDGGFIALNCGALSRDLLAGELFGHVDGAFTGARRGGMVGKIEAADGGSLFLDEIGEMPLDLQPMFLRVLQEMEICRIGDTRTRKVEFRLIAASNRDLSQEVAEGRFRMDLYYRISSMTLSIPPLRERGGDVSLLAGHILAQLAEQHDGAVRTLSPSLLQQLQGYHWPGNIRELSNLVTAAFFLSDRVELGLEDLPADFQSVAAEQPQNDGGSPLDNAEKDVIAAAIRQQGGNLTQVARQLNIAKSTLYLKLKKYGLKRD